MVSRLDTKTELGAIKELKEEYLEPFMHLMMQYECDAGGTDEAGSTE